MSVAIYVVVENHYDGESTASCNVVAYMDRDAADTHARNMNQINERHVVAYDAWLDLLNKKLPIRREAGSAEKKRLLDERSQWIQSNPFPGEYRSKNTYYEVETLELE